MKTVQKIQFTQTLHQIDYLEREEERIKTNKILAALRKKSESCFTCKSFHNPSILISVCKTKQHKQVKFYNLCEKWEKKS
jgi:hypothetical protein